MSTEENNNNKDKEKDPVTDDSESIYPKDYDKIMDNAGSSTDFSHTSNKVSDNTSISVKMMVNTAEIRKKLSVYRYPANSDESESSNVDKIKAEFFTPRTSKTKINGKLPEYESGPSKQKDDLDNQNIENLVYLLKENLGTIKEKDTHDSSGLPVGTPFEERLAQSAKKLRRNSSSDIEVGDNIGSLSYQNLNNHEETSLKTPGISTENNTLKVSDNTNLLLTKCEGNNTK